MQQQFSTRNYSIRDFEEWRERGELVLAPKFQRRQVWNDKARSYLIDTIVRGKPIPKLYMRQEVDPKSRRTTREIVDGQQRLHTALTFIKDGFKLRKTHNEALGGKFFSDFDTATQKAMLQYEFVVDLLQDMPDNEIYDLFARINTYSEKLKPQELRNAKWFGEFKSSVYLLSLEFVPFLEAKKVLTAKQILRMGEAELISELLLAMEEGIKEKKKTILDAAYKRYDDSFPNRRKHEKRFRETIDLIGEVVGDKLPTLKLRSERLFYSMFCAFFHIKFGMPKLSAMPFKLKASAYPKVANALEQIDELVDTDPKDAGSLGYEEQRFYAAYSEHWVHADKRTTMTQYIVKQIQKAVKG